jgi:periplasmic divalent cation tolerance protein
MSAMNNESPQDPTKASIDSAIDPSQLMLVLTTMPDNAHAEKLAGLLVTQQLAACVNIMAPCVSVYEWPEDGQPKLQNTTEIPLMIKTTQGRYAAVEAAIRSQHPYELPEVLRVGIDGGLPAYIDWVIQQTSPRGILT